MSDIAGFGTFWCKHCGAIMQEINVAKELFEWRVPLNLPKASHDSLLSEMAENINKKFKDDKHVSLRQFEKWFAKGYNQAIKDILKEIADISI